MRWTLFLLAGLLFGQHDRVVESIVPELSYSPECSSTLVLRNLSGRAVPVQVEGHRASGALAPLAGQPGMTVRLGPHERETYSLEIEDETTGAWVKVRERVPAAAPSPVVAVSASTECRVGNLLRTVMREVAFPMRSPWFSSDVDRLRDGMILLINTSERPAGAWACYSSGSLYSLPGAGRGADLQPVCSTAFEVQVPPFGTREFPVSRDGSSHFTLRTRGDAIVLQMLRPIEASLRVYTVDSTIRFGEEVRH